MCDLCNYFIKTFHCSNIMETFGIGKEKGISVNDKCLKVYSVLHSVSLDMLTLFLCCELERQQPRQLHMRWGVVLHPCSTQAFLSLQVPHFHLDIFYL